MIASTALALAALGNVVPVETEAQNFIGRQTVNLANDCFTPEALWAMGRIGSVSINPTGTTAVYSVSYYSISENKSHSVLYVMPFKTRVPQQLTTSVKSESGAVWIKDAQGRDRIAFLTSESGSSQIWTMAADGTDRRQATFEADDVLDFLFSPDSKRLILVKEVSQRNAIQENDADLPLSTGMVINDMMYKHWDHYVTTVPHPFLANFDGEKATVIKDLLEGEPFESPMMPFGGSEQLAWSPDSRQVAYTCRKKVGRDYAVSTDSDIYLYDISTGTTRNLCKPEGWQQPAIDYTRSLKNQSINQQSEDANVGYDKNPIFSPNGKYIAWSSMERDGYESDRSRLCIYELSTGKKKYVTEKFESDVDAFVWAADNKTIYFSGVWHGMTNLYSTNLKGEVKSITNEQVDYVLLGIMPDGKNLLTKRHSMSAADEIFIVDIKSGTPHQMTEENKWFYDNVTMGKVEARWTKTTDGKDLHSWVIYPPHFDPTKKYPTLLFCQGGPQSAVSQFWSYRWNFQVMAAQGYIIIAPNRRGLPGFGMEWLEAISGDYTGGCMQDYLNAIDDIAQEPYVDRNCIGAVGASFGGFSVYWLAGHHNKRFKAFIAHDGIFNTQQQYLETEELWFANWDMGAAPWLKNANGQTEKVFNTSPHLYVDKWDTPILCISGQKDFRIEYTQTQSAFTAARLRGVPAQMLLFPDENHWVLRPQNGMLWQRTFFRWLDKYLK